MEGLGISIVVGDPLLAKTNHFLISFVQRDQARVQRLNRIDCLYKQMGLKFDQLLN